QCGFDAGTMFERYPQLLEEIRGFPLPVSQLTCSFLPVIKDEAAARCSSFIGLPGNRNVGTENHGISVFGSNPRSCQPGLLRIELNRTDRNGHSITMTALLRGEPR